MRSFNLCFILSTCAAKINVAPARSRQTGGMVIARASDHFSANEPDVKGCPKNSCYSIDNGKCVANEKCYHVNCRGGAAVEFKFKEKFKYSFVFRHHKTS